MNYNYKVYELMDLILKSKRPYIMGFSVMDYPKYNDIDILPPEIKRALRNNIVVPDENGALITRAPNQICISCNEDGTLSVCYESYDIEYTDETEFSNEVIITQEDALTIISKALEKNLPLSI